MPEVRYGRIPFREAIEYFRQKIDLPARSWTDLWQGMHARAFVIAGAMREELIADLRHAVDRAISEGISLSEFRRQFDEIVARYGWQYRGGRDWRTRVIYDTNLRTAYAAGRYKQMTDPNMIRLRPYWQYRHGGSAQPRPDHLSWDGLVLRADDPWWRTHYPPNGWGCSCYVRPLDEEGLRALGKTGPDQAPPVRYVTRTVQGRRIRVPEGIDPGWDYNVGEAAWGRWDPVLEDRRLKPLPFFHERDWRTYGLPERLETPPARLTEMSVVSGREGAVAVLRRVLRDREVLEAPRGLRVHVEPESLAMHLERKGALGRLIYAELLPEIIERPQEVWVQFFQDPRGRVVLRTFFLRAYTIGAQQKQRVLLFIGESEKGQLRNVTFIPMRQNWRRINDRYRKGLLLHAQQPGA